MFCPKCGKELIENSAFCGFCGCKIEFNEKDSISNTKASSDTSASIPDSPSHEEENVTNACSGTVAANRIKMNRKMILIVAAVLIVISAVIVYLCFSLTIQAVKIHYSKIICFL